MQVGRAIAQSFVTDYYTALEKDSEKLSSLFSQDAVVSYGIGSQNTPSVEVKTEISKLFGSHVELDTITTDFVGLNHDTIIVMVTGSMQLVNKKSNRFAQTFVLLKDAKNTYGVVYYLKCDMLRFIHESSSTTSSVVVASAAASTTAVSTVPTSSVTTAAKTVITHAPTHAPPPSHTPFNTNAPLFTPSTSVSSTHSSIDVQHVSSHSMTTQPLTTVTESLTHSTTPPVTHPQPTEHTVDLHDDHASSDITPPSDSLTPTDSAIPSSSSSSSSTSSGTAVATASKQPSNWASLFPKPKPTPRPSTHSHSRTHPPTSSSSGEEYVLVPLNQQPNGGNGGSGRRRNSKRVGGGGGSGGGRVNGGTNPRTRGNSKSHNNNNNTGNEGMNEEEGVNESQEVMVEDAGGEFQMVTGRNSKTKQQQQQQQQGASTGNKWRNESETNVLFVKYSMTANVSEEDLRAALEPFGSIERISSLPHKGQAFIHYTTNDAVKESIAFAKKKGVFVNETKLFVVPSGK